MDWIKCGWLKTTTMDDEDFYQFPYRCYNTILYDDQLNGYYSKGTGEILV